MLKVSVYFKLHCKEYPSIFKNSDFDSTLFEDFIFLSNIMASTNTDNSQFHDLCPLLLTEKYLSSFVKPGASHHLQTRKLCSHLDILEYFLPYSTSLFSIILRKLLLFVVLHSKTFVSQKMSPSRNVMGFSIYIKNYMSFLQGEEQKEKS